LRRRALRIPSSVRAELERHAREEAPNEACGLLVLQDGEAVRYERGRNAERSPYRYRLEVAPEVWFLEDDGYQLAVFHSHAASPPRPSRVDVEQAGLWQSRPYVILRADTGELAAWRIDGDGFEPLELRY
jgi:proteasome lid subunit RPN8/RPN11